MDEPQEAETPRPRILVGLDASRASLAALKVAAEVAALMQAEVAALYVEDINLLRLCGLPFVREVGSYSATLRPLDSTTLEREFRLLAARMRRTVAQTAVSAKVSWSFRVRRGQVDVEMLQAAGDASLVTLGRVGRSHGKRVGSTARAVAGRARHPVFLLGDEGLTSPLTLIYDGLPPARRALELATLLARRPGVRLRVLVVRSSGQAAVEAEQRAQEIADSLRALDLRGEAVVVDDERLPALLQQPPRGTLIAPAQYAQLLEWAPGSAILVP